MSIDRLKYEASICNVYGFKYKVGNYVYGLKHKASYGNAHGWKHNATSSGRDFTIRKTKTNKTEGRK